MANPTAPIAQAIAEVSKLLHKWLEGTKGRRTTKALDNARKGLSRALKLHPELKDDKTFNKYHKKFIDNIARN